MENKQKHNEFRILPLENRISHFRGMNEVYPLFHSLTSDYIQVLFQATKDNAYSNMYQTKYESMEKEYLSCICDVLVEAIETAVSPDSDASEKNAYDQMIDLLIKPFHILYIKESTSNQE